MGRSRHCCLSRWLMRHLFERDPQQVRWKIASLGDGSYRLVVQHSPGTIVETFASTEQAIRRVQQLVDHLDQARVNAAFHAEGRHHAD